MGLQHGRSELYFAYIVSSLINIFHYFHCVKRLVYTLLLTAVFQFGFSQIEPQFSQYMYNRYLLNPAYAGSEDAVQVALLHRSQYVGIANRFIATQGFNFNLPLFKANSGIGITAMNDLVGFMRATYVALNYDYRKKFKWGNMQIGIAAGFIEASLDGALIRTPEGNYIGGFNHNDLKLPDNIQQGFAPDFSFGVYFNNEKYFAGAALQHIAFSDARIKTPAGSTRLLFTRNLTFMGGYDFKVGSKLKIMPNALLKTDLRKVQTDVALNFTVIDKVLTGVSFRGYDAKSVDALVVFLGVRIKGFQAVYSYDANLSYLTRFNSGSHEVSLRYSYPLKSKEVRGYFYHNPRFN